MFIKFYQQTSSTHTVYKSNMRYITSQTWVSSSAAYYKQYFTRKYQVLYDSHGIMC